MTANHRTPPSIDRPSRRTFLKATAGTGIAAGLAATGTAQELEGGEIELGGLTAGWEGRSPEDIAGETNPTLSLSPGETYTITWENVDGLPHDLVILDDAGEEIVGTEIMDAEGETLSLEFEATAEMAEYYCSVHPTTMRGSIEIGEDDANNGAANETNETNETDGEDVAEDATEIIGEGPTVGLERVAEGFVSPVGFEVAPGEDDRYYVLDQPGQIYVVEDGTSELFLDLSDRMVDVGAATGGGFDERGLLGMAFHPEYRDNRRLFVYYSAPLRDGTGIDAGDDLLEEDTDDNETVDNETDNETTEGEDDGEEDDEGYNHTAVLAEFEATGNFNCADPDSERTLLEVPEPQFNHNGGPVLFGPDGYLYWALGDGGGANDDEFGHVEDWYAENAGGNGQDTTENLLGGIHRIDVDSEGDDGEPYGIPEDNPFVGSDEGLDEYFAWGLRNPWRASFDGDGRLFVADVGQNLFEEVDVVESGGNYGWNVREGIECFSTESPNDPPEECPTETPADVRGGEPLIDPVIQYPHQVGDETIGISITGGYVYENDTIPELQGTYVFGDWSDSFGAPSGNLFHSPVEEYEPIAGRTEEELWDINRLSVANAPGEELSRFVLTFGQDNDGELYVLTTARYSDGETGEVFRIVPADEGEEIGAPENPITPQAEETDDEEETANETDNETAEDETEEIGNETANETVNETENETVGNDTGNETIGSNETGNETANETENETDDGDDGF
ncbi:PQQ-dependent sugar dehydrogenase [Saliphagus sp. LR7]|uniref:PQQ-dependent sugar dehydrogenase n=1 Tax=Saliphagus sp. LR7 TaxID=2282654 RepID=UPI000DF7B800|nr:PQQ-dependent sugar dehydrogenase [Saliphagus sp. LR7]